MSIVIGSRTAWVSLWKRAVSVSFPSLSVEISEAPGEIKSWYSCSVHAPDVNRCLDTVQMRPNWYSHLQCVWEHFLVQIKETLKKCCLLMQSSSIFTHTGIANLSGIIWHSVPLRRLQTCYLPSISFKKRCLHKKNEYIDLIKSQKWLNLKKKPMLN